MHELLLFGQVPASRYDQVLNILAGIAAMQPQPILEKHLVFKPNRKPGSGTQKQVGGAQDIQKPRGQDVQAQELFYLQLVADIDEARKKDGNEGTEDLLMNGDGGIELEKAEVTGQVPLSVGYGIAPLHESGQTNGVLEPSKESPSSGKWTLQFRDLPEVARQRPVTSRLIVDTPITSGDPMKFMTALDYTFVLRIVRSNHSANM